MSLFIKKPTFKASEGRTPLGIPQPQIEVVIPLGTPYNHVSALTHAVAAKVDILRPKDATWGYAQCKVTGKRFGAVWVKLAAGSEEETEAAMKVLNDVVQLHSYAIRTFVSP